MTSNKEKSRSKSKGSNSQTVNKDATHPSANDVVVNPEEPLSENIALDCSLNGDAVRFSRCFDDKTDIYHGLVQDLVNRRSDEDGRAPLDWACLLGRTEMTTELLKRGALINGVGSKGYTSLHLAAAWGQVECLKVLVGSGADIYLQTANKEKACDIARRYDKNEAVDFLEWADAKQQLRNTILAVKETITSADKAKIFAKNEKLSMTALINEKSNWLEKTPDITTLDFLCTKDELEELIASIVQRMNEAPTTTTTEKPEKSKKGEKK